MNCTTRKVGILALYVDNLHAADYPVRRFSPVWVEFHEHKVPYENSDAIVAHFTGKVAHEDGMVVEFDSIFTVR